MTALPHRNAGLSNRPWQEVYAAHPELVAIVAERYAGDDRLLRLRRAGHRTGRSRSLVAAVPAADVRIDGDPAFAFCHSCIIRLVASNL